VKPMTTVLPADLAGAMLMVGQTGHDQRVLRYQAQLIAPMLGGGVRAGTPDLTYAFRSKSIKGHLRWWWRTLALAGDLDDLYDKAQPLSERGDGVRAAEGNLWGSVRGERAKRSQVTLEVSGIKAEGHPFEQQVPGDWGPRWVAEPRVGDLKYAMFPAQHKDGGIGPKDFIAAGGRFSLVLTVKSEKLLDEVKRVVGVWATFGGVGARTRRGIGAVEVHDAHGHLLSVVDSQGVCTLRAVTICVCPSNGTALCFEGPKEAGVRAVKALQYFRQGAGFARNPPAYGSRTPGLSRWPEPHAVRTRTGFHFSGEKGPTGTRIHKTHLPLSLGDHFPRGAFGLPIVLRFQDGPSTTADGQPVVDTLNRDPATRTVNLPDKNRMASPLILRAVAVTVGGKSQYLAVAAVIRRDAANPWVGDVHIQPSAGSSAGAATWDPAWRAGTARGAAGIRPLEDPRCVTGPFPAPANAVQAFMNFFTAYKGEPH